MSNLVSSNAPGKKCKEVTCCAKCTFFSQERKEKMSTRCCSAAAPYPMHLSQRCNGESKKEGNAACDLDYLF